MAAKVLNDEGKKVLLVNSNLMQPPVAPLALDYIAQALEESRFQVDILDLCFSPDYSNSIAGYFASHEVFAVAISFRNTDDSSFATKNSFFPQLKSVVDCFKANTSAPLVLGGAGFSVMPKAVLNYCNLDLGIWGEGEYSLPLLLAKMAKRESFYDIPALVYRVGDGFQCNPPYYLDLGRLSTPQRSLIDNRRYFEEGGMNCLETKRGCPRGCIYCADPVSKGKKVRLRSPKSVVDEMETLVNQGIDHLHLCDCEFNIPEYHAKEVCVEIVNRELGGKVRWYTYASPVPFSRELALLVKAAGCAGINFGVDSGCDRMLQILGRDFCVEDLRSTARFCREEGIVFMYDLLLGAPGETRESLKETIQTMKEISPERVGAALGVRIYSKTKLADMVQKEGPLADNPNLHGITQENGDFSAPIFYLSQRLGDDAPQYLSSLVGNDERFFLHNPEAADKHYNYDDNATLVEAIRSGYRGAFWDILRRLPDIQRNSVEANRD